MIGVAFNAIAFLLVIIQNATAQSSTNNAGLPTSSAVNYNTQPSPQINWQQPSNAQQACLSQQCAGNSQANSVPDMFSTLQNVRFSFQPTNPPCYEQASSSTKYQEPKPSFSFQYIPGPPPNQIASSAQQYVQSPASQQPPLYLLQNSNPTVSVPQSSPNQIPIVLTMVPQTTAQSKSSSNLPKKLAKQPTNMSENPMAMLMSQLSGSENPDMSSFLPMLMNSKQDKGGGMKSLLPLIFNLLNNDRGCCTCPNCGCPCSEPTVLGGYSNLKNYGKAKSVDLEESGEVEVVRAPKKVKVKEVSDEVVDDDEDDDDEYEDDEE